MDIPILYEDDDIVVINKPAGLMTHADGRSETPTVADWFAEKYPASAHVGEPMKLTDGRIIDRPGIVHRLDTETSGALVLAKTPEAHAFLKAAFKEREVKKSYLAFVYGVPKDKIGVINFAIGRSRKDFRLRSAQPKAQGTLRDAITNYEVLGDIGTHSLVKAMPETGRTHQIRVHFKAIHHPIVGDKLYAPGLSKSKAIGNKPQSSEASPSRAPNHPADLGFDRLGLHAREIDIPLPSGGRKTVLAPVPPDLALGLERFALPEGTW